MRATVSHLDRTGENTIRKQTSSRRSQSGRHESCTPESVLLPRVDTSRRSLGLQSPRRIDSACRHHKLLCMYSRLRMHPHSPADMEQCCSPGTVRCLPVHMCRRTEPQQSRHTDESTIRRHRILGRHSTLCHHRSCQRNQLGTPASCSLDSESYPHLGTSLRAERVL